MFRFDVTDSRRGRGVGLGVGWRGREGKETVSGGGPAGGVFGSLTLPLRGSHDFDKLAIHSRDCLLFLCVSFLFRIFFFGFLLILLERAVS